ncbi:2-amino-4-hydroxy-6-hydroxymethyldihydropteridine diphosphokinase [Adhaeribacter aquaticus]|uniref:2-amino-4-hydroxy-6- hydroxymethyldihydropteridine diphosphokinase n=1 Tax=Adhaeribacter aquaticus TaxID=299567 RepID=UPI0004076DD1|nr:2-amino-4-hydroxy-6-hydroxymethyldihydropteridine diphosphokinase [Adhaeribacter aquaticus]
MPTSYLLLGGNQGNREYYLSEAINRISLLPGTIGKCSALYETAAWGVEDQPAFLNQAVKLNTSLTPPELLLGINKIEKDLGRIREIKWAARIIDIDIIYYGNTFYQTESLTIPHPHLQERRFVLMPLVEIAPDFVHPVLLKTNLELLAACSDQLEVRPYKTTEPL